MYYLSENIGFSESLVKKSQTNDIKYFEDEFEIQGDSLSLSKFRGKRWKATMNTHFVLHIHLSLTFFSSFYMYYMNLLFSETEKVYECLLKSTWELSLGIVSSHYSKELKAIREGKETKVL